MATPKPGEIRCPTCHRSTPPAGFCTQCGSAIPADARIRPRGLDRDELQDRIRARRSGGEPFRRGGASGAEMAGYERFALEPEDEAARHSTSDAPRSDLLGDVPPRRPAATIPFDTGSARDDERHAPNHPDLTREEDEWVAPAAATAGHDADARPSEPAPHLASVEDYREPDSGGLPQADYDEAGYADDYEYTDWQQEPRQRRSAGAGALAILGFLALGVLALLGGAVLAGVFGDDPQTGQVETSPAAAAVSSSPLASNSAEATPEPSASEDGAPSDEPRASGEPIEFADGFVAEVQPCLPGSADVDGCDSNGAISGGALDIWVGFTKGTGQDVISAEIVRTDGTTVSGGTINLADINCRAICNGWTRFSIEGGLLPGKYDILVTRNGTPAGESSFVVS